MASRAFRLAGLAVGLGLSALTAYQRGQESGMDGRSVAAGDVCLDATGSREVAYCHACNHNWWKDEGGIARCPNCGGEAVEIVRPIEPYTLYLRLTLYTIRLSRTMILDLRTRGASLPVLLESRPLAAATILTPSIRKMKMTMTTTWATMDSSSDGAQGALEIILTIQMSIHS